MTRTVSIPGKWLWIVAVALAAVMPYALKVGPDHDLWWHLKTGELILEQGGLPATDPFSFTAEGASWTNHEWLSDAILAGAYSIGADHALMALRVSLLLAVVIGLTVLLWNRIPHPLFVLAGTLLVTPLVRVFMNFRPHAYTYLLTVALLLILEGSRRRPWLLWIVPPMMTLWTNLHGGFLLGLGILGLGLASRWMGWDSDAPPATWSDRKRLVGVCGLSLVAPLINPYGFGLFTYLMRELGADHSLVLEWRGIWDFAQYRAYFVLLVAIPVVALLLARRLKPAMPIALLGLAAVGTWTHGRFLILLVVFSGLVTFSALAVVLERGPWLRADGLLARMRTPAWAWALCLLPLVAGAFQLSSDYKRKNFRIVVDGWTVPVEGCEFLQRYDLGPNLLLRFDWGGYAIWHLYPQYKVSADGRNLTVYGAEFVDDQIRAYHEGRFGDYANEHAADVILSERAGPAYEELLADDDWIRVHEDRVSAVFVPPEVARTLARYRSDALAAQPASERFYFP